ncbi:HTH-type transcriptional regulator BetI [Serratia plymuthica]|nr:HTH-type transcriptional regulator BetI [Serratia plymuthica]
MDHSVRDQIVEAATEHFGHFGYEKTTVSDLAKAIGFSKAYIYKFFDSKQAIGEVICVNRLAMIMEIVNSALADAPTASEKLRRLFKALTEAGSDLFFHDRKLYDIAAVAARERWPSVVAYEERLCQVIQHILLEGRQSGSSSAKRRWMKRHWRSPWCCGPTSALCNCKITWRMRRWRRYFCRH